MLLSSDDALRLNKICRTARSATIRTTNTFLLFENILKNDPFIPMIAGQRKPEGQWTIDERMATNLDQRLKSASCLSFQMTK
nr:hypothetical protein [Tanacetum cinerariifolium]